MNTEIDWWEVYGLKGILCEDNNGSRYLIIEENKENQKAILEIKGEMIDNEEFMTKLAEMLKRYNIADIILGDIDVIRKRVLDSQLSNSKNRRDYYDYLKKQRTGE